MFCKIKNLPDSSKAMFSANKLHEEPVLSPALLTRSDMMSSINSPAIISFCFYLVLHSKEINHLINQFIEEPSMNKNNKYNTQKLHEDI